MLLFSTIHNNSAFLTPEIQSVIQDLNQQKKLDSIEFLVPLIQPWPNLEKIKSTCIAENWNFDCTTKMIFLDKIESNLTNVDVLTKNTVNSKDTIIVNDVFHLSEKIFGMPAQLSERIKRLIASKSTNSVSVVAYVNERPVGCGIAICNERFCLLTAAGVIEEFRNHGLWRHIVSERQKITKEFFNVSKWFYTTTNPYLIKEEFQTIDTITVYKIFDNELLIS